MGFGNVKAERAAIEATYTDTCDVIRTFEKEVNYINKRVTEKVYENIPCGLVMGKSPTNQTDTFAVFNYSVKVIMPPEPVILAGDKFVVRRFGQVLEYNSAGDSAKYETHQEVMLVKEDAV